MYQKFRVRNQRCRLKVRNDLKERPSAAILRRRAFFVYECRIAPYESDPLGGFQIVSASERDYRDNCRKKRYEHRKVFVSFAYGSVHTAKGPVLGIHCIRA